MKNHLIIGLGGTGGKIIRSFRKTVYQEFRKDEPDNVHIAYLYVDSSAEMMELDDPDWKVLGHSVQLGPNSQLKITGSDLETVLDNIQSYPGIKTWIGDRSQWKDILNSVVGEMLGGQKRRLGRFLFANKADQFNERLTALVNSLKHQSSATDVTFHICAGLAGGTGSGTLIDVISQIRSLGFEGPESYRIIVYTLLPDTHPPHNWDTGNYHANGYAALMELNALSTGTLKPHDLTGQKDRLHLKDPFNGCYVFTNDNENGMTVDVDKELPNIVGDFLYQKIVAIQDGTYWATLKKMENAENGDGTPEKAPGSEMPVRSKRFLTFGIKRLAVPEEEILEYLTYTFTRQSALQLLYNNWQDGLGFQDEEKSLDFRVFVQEKDTQLKWKLRDDHLCLSMGILEIDASNKKWKPIVTEWQDFVTNSTLLLRESGNRKAWLDELEKICRKRFDEDFRTLGVKKFYDTKIKAKKDMGREICRLVEADLFDDWKNGVKSVYEISRLLEDLISVTEERLNDVEDRKSRHETREEAAVEMINKNKKEWANTGFIKSAFGKLDKLLDAHAIHLKEFYINRTWNTAWDFAKKLLEELKVEFIDLKNEVDECISKLSQADNFFQNNLAARCNDDEALDLKKHLIRFYQPDMVRKIAERFVKEENVQKGQTGHVRSFLVNKIGENPGFRAFNKNISVIGLMDSLATECEERVKTTHEKLIQVSAEKLLGVSIIERLKNQYSANQQELRSFVKNLVEFAGNYISFADKEKNKRGPGISEKVTCASNFTAILPKAPEHSDFMETLKKTLKESRAQGEVTIVESDLKQNEITLISITNLFPLRFITQIQNLKDKYDRRISGSDSERAKLELHLEGDGSQYPSLFVPTSGENVAMGIPYFLLAKAMGLVLQRENQTTGAQVLSIVTKDEDGFDNDPIDLGDSVFEVPDSLDISKVNLIKDEVEKLMKQKEYLHADKQKEVISSMNVEIDTIKAERGIDDEIYKSFLKGAKEAAKIIKAGR